MPKNHVMLPALLALSVLAAAPSLGLGGCGSDVGPDIDAGAPSDPGKKDAGAKDSTSSVPGESGGDASDATDPDAGDTAVLVDVVTSDADVATTLAARSADCLTCAEAYCSSPLEVCAAGGGTASEGPAAGTSKGQLCNDTLSCFLSSCSIYSAFACYCTSYVTFAQPPYCEVGGLCQEVFERSMESTSAPSVADGFANPTKAGTRAVNLVNCLQENRCKSCFPAPPEAGPDADPDATTN